MEGKMEAGLGEHLVYKIPIDSDDKVELTARNHYIGIDAVAWYVDKDPNWFKKYNDVRSIINST